MFRWFVKSWMNEGRVVDYLEENKITPDRLKQIMKEFLGSEEYTIISMALQDYRERKMKEVINGLKIDHPAYDRVVAQELAFANFPVFFEKFVTELQGFDETEKQERPDKSLKKYK